MSQYQKGKTNLDFTEARDSEWQWHRLGHMQVCTSLQTDNHTSTPPLSFLQAGCPSCRPTNSVKALKAQSTFKLILIYNLLLTTKLAILTMLMVSIRYCIILEANCSQKIYIRITTSQYTNKTVNMKVKLSYHKMCDMAITKASRPRSSDPIHHLRLNIVRPGIVTVS